MSVPARIVVIGSSNTDMVVRVPRIPAPGETVLGGAFLTAAGGKGANQAVAAARLGASVAFVGRIGDDQFGNAALAGLAAEGIDVRYVVRDADAPSGVALIFVDSSGQNSIAVAPGANMRLVDADIVAAEAAIAAADMVVLQCEIPMPAIGCAVALCRRLGVPLMLNPAPATAVPVEVLAGVDTLTPNESEACALLGIKDHRDLNVMDAARRLSAAGPHRVVITLGGQGVVASDDSGVVSYPAFPVTAVDATAAGDCFTAALAVGMAEGSPFAAAIRFAVAASAVSVTVAGAQPSLPTRQAVADFVAAHR